MVSHANRTKIKLPPLCNYRLARKPVANEFDSISLIFSLAYIRIASDFAVKVKQPVPLLTLCLTIQLKYNKQVALIYGTIIHSTFQIVLTTKQQISQHINY